MIEQVILSIVATLGFGILFNIRGKKLIFAALGGGLGWLTYLLSTKAGIRQISAFFICSIIISIYSEIMARIIKTPVTTFIICALIVLVPGSGMYYTMRYAILGDVNASIKIGFQTLAYAGTLALGAIFVSSITKQIKRR